MASNTKSIGIEKHDALLRLLKSKTSFFMSTKEVAILYNRSTTVINRRIANGQIPKPKLFAGTPSQKFLSEDFFDLVDSIEIERAAFGSNDGFLNLTQIYENPSLDVSKKNVAEIFNVSVVTVHRWTKKGCLPQPFIKRAVAYYKGQDLINLIEKSKEN